MSRFFLVVLMGMLGCASRQVKPLEANVSPFSWQHLSTSTGDLEPPNTGNQQTACLVFDINGDGIQDFIVAERTKAPSVVAYIRTSQGWNRHVVEAAPLRIEAGATHYDIDRDGDQDLVLGGDNASNEVWWWENPGKDLRHDMGWVRRTVKKGGENKHHDQLFGDFTGDGVAELIFWNQRAKSLMMAEIPAQPKQVESWVYYPIYTYSDTAEPPQRGVYPAWKTPNEHEGLAAADIDGDGITDIVGGGRWFSYAGNKRFEAHEIDPSYAFSRAIAGQFKPGGRPEVVFVAGDGVAPLMFYEWAGNRWKGTMVVDSIWDGHSISMLDANGDTHLDVFIAEMGLGKNPHPIARLLLGNGRGKFAVEELFRDYGLHESVMTDLDGDGDADILGKPYTWKAPRLDIWLRQ